MDVHNEMLSKYLHQRYLSMTFRTRSPTNVHNFLPNSELDFCHGLLRSILEVLATRASNSVHCHASNMPGASPGLSGHAYISPLQPQSTHHSISLPTTSSSHLQLSSLPQFSTSSTSAMAPTTTAPQLRLLLLALCAMAVSFSAVHAADPDPLQAFCVADLSATAPLVNGYACRPRSEATAQDFVYTGFRQPGGDVNNITQAPTGAIVALAGPQLYPGLNTQGITHARLDFAIGGVVPLHTHPRAAETLLVLKGTIYTGFISDDNVLYAATLQVGDVILFPKALLHFQLNVGNETAITFNSLTSQNPGLLLSANQIFEPSIPSAVIEKSFGIDAATVKLLKASYPGHP